MINGLLDKLRGARRIGLFAALALVALAALLLLGGGGKNRDSVGEKTALEARLERTLSDIEGIGRVSVMISEDAEGNAVGALVVAEGLKDVRTYLSVQSAVAKLLKLDLDQIEIIGKGGQFGGTI